jgi:thymidylate kinase
MPDLVLFVDVDAEEAYRRVLSRKKQQRFYEQPEQLQRISAAFRALLLDARPAWLPPVAHFLNVTGELEHRVETLLLPVLRRTFEERHAMADRAPRHSEARA